MSATPAPTISLWAAPVDARASGRHGLVFAIVFLQLNQRPAMLQAVGELVFAAVLGGMALYLWFRFPLTLTPHKRAFLLAAGAFGLYLLFQGLLLQTGASLSALTNLAFVSVSVLAVLFVGAGQWTAALKAFVYPVLALSVSYAITATLLLAAGYSLPSLALTSFRLEQVDTFYEMTIYFPFSPALGFGDVKALGFSLARATGYYREPGIYQVLVSISFFGLDYLDIRFKMLWRVLLLASLLFTFSTAGYGAFIVTAFFYYVLAGAKRGARKAWWAPVVGAAAIVPLVWWFVFTDKSFGLLRKLNFASGTVRVERASNAMHYFWEHPLFGGGYMHPDISSINFVSVIGQIGAVGVILLLLAILVPNWALFRRRDPVVALLIPAFLTMLFSQPLFDKPLFFLTLALVVAYPHREAPRRPIWLKPAPAVP
jgi:hypothetical protein